MCAKLQSVYYFCHVCLVDWNNSAPTGQIFTEFDFFFLKSVEKIQV